VTPTIPSAPSSPAPATASDQPPTSGLEQYVLNKRQTYVWDSVEANEVLYGGAKGGGKSFLIRFLFCIWCAATPGLQCYIFRRLYPDLWGNHMEGPSSFHVMLAKMTNLGRCAVVGREVRWDHGARIFLNHLQLDKHVLKYQGREIHVLGLDEATQFSEFQIRYLFGSVRLGNFLPTGPFAQRFPCIIYGANPGGVSHGFIKERFIDSQPPYQIVQRDEPGEKAFRRQFIPARAEDNPELLRNDPLYLDRLEAMGDKMLVKAMREGDWSVIAGGMFADFRKTMGSEPWHVREPFAIPYGWEVWRGGDDGYVSPASCHWLTRDPDSGTYYVIDELYMTGLLPGEYATRVLARDKEIPRAATNGEAEYNDEPMQGLMDSAAFAETGQAIISRGNQMNVLGTKWRPVEKWPGSRKDRVKNLHRLLAPNPQKPSEPGIVFFTTCPNAVRTIPALMRSERDPEDIDDSGEDHAFDSVTYGLQWKKMSMRRVRVGGF
jgi:hypothetical protein